MREGLDGAADAADRSEHSLAGCDHVAGGVRAVAGRAAARLHVAAGGRGLADDPRPRASRPARISPTRCNWMRFSGLSWTEGRQRASSTRAIRSRRAGERCPKRRSSGHALYYHVVGTPQSQDRLIYANTSNPTWFVTGGLTEDGRYLLVVDVEGRRQQQPAVSRRPAAIRRKPHIAAPHASR